MHVRVAPQNDALAFLPLFLRMFILISWVHVLVRLWACWTQHTKRSCWKVLHRLNASLPCGMEEHELLHCIVELTALILGRLSVSGVRLVNRNLIHLGLSQNDIVCAMLEESHVVETSDLTLEREKVIITKATNAKC